MLKDILIYISAYIGLFIFSYYLLAYFFLKKEDKKPLKKWPKVSIIIPAYNEEKGIRATIKSALNIDYPEDKLEVIVVDDGSKDNTLKEAKKIKDKRLKVFSKKNGGKGKALNFGIKRAKGEIIITMDADTFAEKNVLKEIIPYFSNPKVMCVAPSMAIYKPKGILQRIQQIEYFMGVYLRKVFSNLNAIHITPGAFSSYRGDFFKKYGGFDENNITEDMELSLRIQYHNYLIKCSDKAIVYTKAPNTFLHLLKQRRRWYFGLLKNLWHYRALISRKYGNLGMIVLPVALTTIFLSIFLTSYILITSLLELKKDFILFKSINFNFSTILELNKFVFERYFFILFSKPITPFLIFFILILCGYMVFAKKRVKKYSEIKISIFFFLFFYSFLFAFWWIVSLFYLIFVGKVSWGKELKTK